MSEVQIVSPPKRIDILNDEDISIITRIKDMASSVYSGIGTGMSEAIYHMALEVELREGGISYETEFPIPVIYKNHSVGVCRGDIRLINERMILELKATRNVRVEHINQIRGYLRSLGNTVGMIVNFPQESTRNQDKNDSEIVVVHVNHGRLIDT